MLGRVQSTVSELSRTTNGGHLHFHLHLGEHNLELSDIVPLGANVVPVQINWKHGTRVKQVYAMRRQIL